MKRLLWAGALLLSCGAAIAALREPQGDPKLAPGEKAPQLLYGRRQIPGEADPYVLRDVDLPALRARLERADGKPGDGDARAAAYTLLLWHVHAILSVKDEETRADLYEASESLYLSLLGERATAAEPDLRLESNASFLIGAAWVAWKGFLDPLARDRLRKSAALKEGQYRLAAEMMAERTPYRAGLETAVAKVLEGDAAGALTRIDEVLQKNPGDVPARYWRGVALLKLNRPAEAIASLDALLAAQPRDAAALEARAAGRAALKEWMKAVEDWEAAVALDPGARGRLQPYLDAARRRDK